MTEAVLHNVVSSARTDNPATVPLLEGEVLDQAKGPPPPRSVLRRDHGNLGKQNSDTNDNSSKA
jgi:hypothetical protein